MKRPNKFALRRPSNQKIAESTEVRVGQRLDYQESRPDFTLPVFRRCDFLAVSCVDGYGENERPWLEVLRELKLPKGLQNKAKSHLQEIWVAETRKQAENARIAPPHDQPHTTFDNSSIPYTRKIYAKVIQYCHYRPGMQAMRHRAWLVI